MSLATESIAPNSYVDATIFQHEQQAIFESNWYFVCFADELSQPNDFVTRTIGRTPVVVQNIKGELNALLNICSHRKATLQTQESGNRALRCPYHCWGYGQKGKLQSVPQERSDFAFDAEQKEALALRQFDCQQCGDFVFVRVSPSGESLQQFLGDYYEVLKSLSSAFVDPIHSGEYLWQTNWKVAVETVLEVYHVPGTHPESFVKLAKSSCEIVRHGKHNTGHTPLQDTPKKWWAGVRKHLKLEQYTALSEYNHFFIYPNLAIGLTNGSLMSVQTYEPVTASQSKLRFRLRMIGRTDGKATSEAVKAAVKDNFVSFNHTTLEEDRVVAESCQQNMSLTDIPGVLGVCEGRIAHFHQTWRQGLEVSE